MNSRRENESEDKLVEDSKVSFDTEPEVKNNAAKERKVISKNREIIRGIDSPSMLSRTS